MADIEDDDDYGSDDAFDDLPPNTLLDLERSAFLSTQQNPQVASFNTNFGQNRRLQLQNQDSVQSDRTVQNQQEPEDYGFDDEDVVDLDQVDSYPLQQAYKAPPSVVRQGRPQSFRTNSYGSTSAPAGPGAAQPSVAELQARILQLEDDRTKLRKQVQEATSTAQSKAGEAAILRQKAEKAAKDYEQKVSTLRNLHAEEVTKQKVELNRVRSEREKLTTDNRFLEHDLALESGRNRQIQKSQRPIGNGRIQSGQHASPGVTPKRSKVLPFRDGFDDSDLPMLSPSKPKDRSKPATPSKAGAKRKRIGNDVQSPIQPLQLPLSGPKPVPVAPEAQVEAKVASDLLQKLAKEQNKLRFVQRILRHPVSEESTDNVFAALAAYTLPSDPEKKLSSILYDELSSHSIAGSSGNVQDLLFNTLLSIWDRCLAESYYPPISSLVSSVQSILDSERFAFARRFIARVVPLVVATSDLVAIPLARASLNKTQSSKASVAAANAPTNVNRSQQQGDTQGNAEGDSLERYIDVLSCLQILNSLAVAAAPAKDAIRLFWENMKFDFVLLILMKAQPMEQITLMLEILRTSAFDTSFGAIENDGDRQYRREMDTLDRLSLLLAEKFENATPTAIFELRGKVVDVFTALVLTERGGMALATHRFVIGRLFKFLHTSINNLYTYTHPMDHEPLLRSVNACMKILYQLCSSSGMAQLKVNVDVRQKLSILPGGMHIHLLALTRLAFAERIWFEKGIEEGTVERAHEMLDEWLSPEEGEGLMMMFGSEGSGDGMETQ